MSRLREEYRQHTILAAIHEGKCKGRVWKLKKLIHEREGNDPQSLILELRDWVDMSISEQGLERGEKIEYDDLLRSMQQVLPTLTDKQLSMLKAHYNAPNQEATASYLAKAAGYKSYSGANMQYGFIGKALQELSPMKLPKRKDGSDIYTFYLATAGDRTDDEGSWHWKLRPEVAKVIEYLGLNL